jgi:hypothetical protein
LYTARETVPSVAAIVNECQLMPSLIEFLGEYVSPKMATVDGDLWPF